MAHRLPALFASLLALGLAALHLACGGGGGGAAAGPSGPPAVVSVTVQAANLNLQQGQSTLVSASVQGSTSTTVTWSASGGVVTGSGATITYTAPAEPGLYQITATSQADTTQSATLTVAVSSPITPAAAAVIVDAATAAKLASVSADGTTLTFNGSTDQLAGLGVGSVLAFGSTALTPGGLACKVDQVLGTGGQTVLTVEPAALGEVVQSGAIAFSQSLDLASATFVPSPQLLAHGFRVGSVQMRRSQIASSGKVLDQVINLVGPDQVTLTLTLSDLSVAGAAPFASGQPLKVHLAVHCTATLTESVTWNVWAKTFGPYAWSLGELTMPPFPLANAPYIIVQPKAELLFSASGSTAAGLTVTASVTCDATSGFDWNPSDGLKSFFIAKPTGTCQYTLQGEAGLKLSLEPRVTASIEGGAVDLWLGFPYSLDLKADITRNPWWTLTGSVDWHFGADLFKTLHLASDLHPITGIVPIAQASGGLGGPWLEFNLADTVTKVPLNGNAFLDATLHAPDLVNSNPQLMDYVIEEGGAGGTLNGTTYTSPAASGIYHVTATSQALPSLKRTGTLRVGSLIISPRTPVAQVAEPLTLTALDMTGPDPGGTPASVIWTYIGSGYPAPIQAGTGPTLTWTPSKADLYAITATSSSDPSNYASQMVSVADGLQPEFGAISNAFCTVQGSGSGCGVDTSLQSGEGSSFRAGEPPIGLLLKNMHTGKWFARTLDHSATTGTTYALTEDGLYTVDQTSESSFSDLSHSESYHLTWHYQMNLETGAFTSHARQVMDMVFFQPSPPSCQYRHQIYDIDDTQTVAITLLPFYRAINPGSVVIH